MRRERCPALRAAPFVGLSWVPLLSVTRLSPFVRAVRSPPFRHRCRTLFVTAYADHAKHHSEDCAKRDDCLRIQRRHLLQRLPGVAKHLRQFQQNTLPKRGYYFAAATHRNARRCLARGALYRAAQIACAITPFVSTLFQRSAILQFYARVAERQTRRSQKPISKGVWVRIPPRAPFFLGNPPTTEQNEHEAPRTAGFERPTTSIPMQHGTKPLARWWSSMERMFHVKHSFTFFRATARKRPSAPALAGSGRPFAFAAMYSAACFTA